jgi:ribosomal protein S27E
MHTFIDLTNDKFGKLTVLEMTNIKGKYGKYCKCKCECGNETIVSSKTLREGRCKSCGCNTNQSKLLKFKRENPNVTYDEIVKERIKIHTKWNGECLEWQATVSKNGYGVFVYNKKTINASRATWIAHHGEIPKGLCVLHKCDNRKCCRLSHLFLGTHQLNTLDMIKKGRDNWQTCRKFPIGTREKVWELRCEGKKYKEICELMNLTMDQVKSLLQNQKNKLKNCQ